MQVNGSKGGIFPEGSDADRICKQEFERYKMQRLKQWGSKPQRKTARTEMTN